MVKNQRYRRRSIHLSQFLAGQELILPENLQVNGNAPVAPPRDDGPPPVEHPSLDSALYGRSRTQSKFLSSFSLYNRVTDNAPAAPSPIESNNPPPVEGEKDGESSSDAADPQASGSSGKTQAKPEDKPM